MSPQNSMTGYGRYQGEDTEWSQTWEVKSVNSRYLDMKWRLPVHLRSREPALEKIVREYASRGRVDISLGLQLHSETLSGASLNKVQARSMINELKELAEGEGVMFTPDLNRFLSVSSLWEDPMAEPDERMTSSLEQGLRQALANWNESRAAEGRHLVQDLHERVERLTALREEIAGLAPKIKEEKFEAQRGRVQNMLDRYEIEIDESRLLQEMATLADRLDISEELTRLDAHLRQLQSLLNNGAEAGKRLDFVLQECFREANTCGNKAQDSDVSKLVVDFKAELEKCREQVQNLE